MRTASIIMLALALAACRQSESPVPQTNPNPEPSAAPAETTGKGTVADPVVTTDASGQLGDNVKGGPGNITVASLAAAQNHVPIGQPFAESIAKVEAELGAKMAENDDRYLWWTMSDGKCHVLSVEKEGDKVGRAGVTSFGPDQTGPWGYDLCKGEKPE